jgi:ubiquinone/menaquinone biosynthesis C-methylase UbiE
MENPLDKPRAEVHSSQLDKNRAWEDNTTPDSAHVRLIVLKNLLQKYQVPFDKNTKLLEVGSGNGVMIDLLQKEGIPAVGVDIRPRGSSEIPQAAARIEQLPFASDSFDIIISSQIFDDVVYKQDQGKMLAEISRILKSGGLYIGRSEHIKIPPENMSLLSDPAKITQDVVYRKTKVES